MSDASRVQLSSAEEVTLGVIPAVAFQAMRFTSDSLSENATTTQSEEIRGDRQTADIVRNAVEVAGDVNVEMSYLAHDQWLEGVMMGDYTAELSIAATTIDAASGDNSFNDSGSGFGSVVVGQWIKVAGFTDPANNGFFLVTSAAAGKLIVTAGTLVTEAVGGSVTINGSMLRNGVTKKSYTLEREYADLSNEFMQFLGLRVGALTLSITPGAMFTAAFSMQGLQQLTAAASASTGAILAAPTNQIMNTIDNIKDIREDGAVTTLDVLELSLSLTNNLRSQPAVGSLTPIGIGLGRFALTGTLNAYFDDSTLVDKFIAFSESALTFRSEDPDGNAYVFTMPKIKYTAAPTPTPGNDADVVQPLEFACKLDPVTGTMFQIDRFAA